MLFWTHSDRHPRNWNYLRICESLWRAVVATCKSKHPWQSNRTWGTTAYSIREPRHFHPFVHISIWQLVSLGLICRATRWCRDSFVLHCAPASPLLPNKPVRCKQKKKMFKRLWDTLALCSQMFLRVTSALDTPAQATKLEGLRRKKGEKKTEIENKLFYWKAEWILIFLPPVWVFWTQLWKLAPPSQLNASRS